MSQMKQWPAIHSACVVELLMGLGVMVIGAVFLFEVHSEPRPYGDPGDLGSAAFFPGLVALAVTILGGLMALLSWRPGNRDSLLNGHLGRVLLGYALMTLLAVSLPWLGIWLVAMTCVPLMALLFGERRWSVLLALALIPPFMVVQLFEGAMGIYFPRGIIL
ncbi:tripartite tricarboxylate transporter TctB family protein [Marinobacter zhejiangensis]|uniref:Tripartite tricarboxylate transporter TctB family protein n=1 Tax=Marinobacter zhejiangensis TaxID=488535 RepID=A0A1I4NTL0_9GAMM|nr:tripartite tricarboxylate transporter TctB family protein [Marinobacter zhejiangensis]SFM18799.1 Tripartite tricarboxylate transporter TctB family protein [Marinobacter zhejiangensis]